MTLTGRAVFPPMPLMIDCGEGFSVSVEALGYFARGGNQKAQRLLDDAGVAWATTKESA